MNPPLTRSAAAKSLMRQSTMRIRVEHLDAKTWLANNSRHNHNHHSNGLPFWAMRRGLASEARGPGAALLHQQEGEEEEQQQVASLDKLHWPTSASFDSTNLNRPNNLLLHQQPLYISRRRFATTTTSDKPLAAAAATASNALKSLPTDSGMLALWQRVKNAHPDALVFFQNGDFYEIFQQDVEICCTLLNIREAAGREYRMAVRFFLFSCHLSMLRSKKTNP